MRVHNQKATSSSGGVDRVIHNESITGCGTWGLRGYVESICQKADALFYFLRRTWCRVRLLLITMAGLCHC